MLFNTSGATIDELSDALFVEKKVQVFVLRLDKIHPVVSGNKLFKLHYFLEEALSAHEQNKAPGKTIVTFGGAYSNHLVATAYACNVLGLKCIGIVRGEKPALLSHSLQQCSNDGMQLHFISRSAYHEKDDPAFLTAMGAQFGDCILIPEGGYHPMGAKGAALMMNLIARKNFTHVCTASGTATTLAGLLMAATANQQIINVPVLKGLTDINERLNFLTGSADLVKNIHQFTGYHFGGYAKKTEALLDFMNECWLKHKLPLDFVYTAKMMFAVIDKIKHDNFAAGSKILCVHTGGLQGNKSLPLGRLLF